MASAEQTVHRILSEDVLTLADARRELVPILGRRLDKSTIYRWCLRGIDGTKLEHIRLGGRVLTSKQALTRFCVARSK